MDNRVKLIFIIGFLGIVAVAILFLTMPKQQTATFPVPEIPVVSKPSVSVDDLAFYRETLAFQPRVRGCFAALARDESLCDSSVHPQNCKDWMLDYRQSSFGVRFGAVLQKQCSYFEEKQGIGRPFCEAIISNDCASLDESQRSFCNSLLGEGSCANTPFPDTCEALSQVLRLPEKHCTLDNGLSGYVACRGLIGLDCEAALTQTVTDLYYLERTKLGEQSLCDHIESVPIKTLCLGSSTYEQILSVFFPSSVV